MAYERDFKGIWIPKEVWLSNALTMQEKLFYVEIDSLDNEQGCFASNSHFAEFFDVSKGRCTQIIKSLESKKLITINLEYKGKQVVRRLIRVVNKLNTPLSNPKYPYLENAEDNNTTINNTVNNTAKSQAVYLPAWVDEKAWSEWVAFRKEIKKSLTKTTIQKQLNFLGKYEYDHVAIINQSIQNGWTGLFPLKKESNQKPTYAPVNGMRANDMIDAIIRKEKQDGYQNSIG